MYALGPFSWKRARLRNLYNVFTDMKSGVIEMLSLHKYHFSFIACSSNPHHQATMQASGTKIQCVVSTLVWDLCGINTGVGHVTSHMIGEWQVLYSYNLMFRSA